MKRAWGRVVLALLVVGAAVGLVVRWCDQRVADADFLVLPGPAEVTYDELIAYRATFTTTSKATLQNVRFQQEFPTAEGQETGPPVVDTCPTCPRSRRSRMARTCGSATSARSSRTRISSW